MLFMFCYFHFICQNLSSIQFSNQFIHFAQFTNICAIIYRLSIYFSGQGIMTSKSHILYQLRQEIEQGQIPSNTQRLNTLSLRGSANNGDHAGLNIYPNSRINTSAVQPSGYSQEPFKKQTKNIEQGRSQKKLDRQFLITSENQKSQIAQRFEPSANSWRNSHRNDQYQEINSYRAPDYGFDKFNSKNNSYNLNQTNVYESYKGQQYLWNEGRHDQINVPYTTYEYQNYGQNRNNFYQNASSSYFKTDRCLKNAQTMREQRQMKWYKNGGDKTNKMEPGVKVEVSRKEVKLEKRSISESIGKHKNYFEVSDWQRLLFIIEEILLENNNGVRHLWNFMNKFAESKRFGKGKRVFRILGELGMEEVFDELIAEEQRYKKKKKQKQTKFKTLIFSLVKKIS